MSNQGPYLNFGNAAEYCGYHPDHFRRLTRGANIPRLGPNRNRFAQADLERFMADPDAFKGAVEQHITIADLVEG